MSDNEQEMNQASTEVSETTQTVSIKPLIFIESNVIASFSVMEMQINIMRIRTPIQQFHHVLAALPPEIVCKLLPTILQSGDYVKLTEGC